MNTQGNWKIQALQNKVLRAWQKDKDSARSLGRALVQLRDAMKPTYGAFTIWYRANGLNENRVFYCIRLVEGKIKKPESADGGPKVKLHKISLELKGAEFDMLKWCAKTKGISPADFVLNLVKKWYEENYMIAPRKEAA